MCMLSPRLAVFPSRCRQLSHPKSRSLSLIARTRSATVTCDRSMVFSFARLAAVAAAEDDADVSFGNFGNFIVETFAFVGALAAAPFALSKLALTASFPGALRGIETAALLLMTLLTLYGEKARIHCTCLRFSTDPT